MSDYFDENEEKSVGEGTEGEKGDKKDTGKDTDREIQKDTGKKDASTTANAGKAITANTRTSALSAADRRARLERCLSFPIISACAMTVCTEPWKR